MNWRFWHRWVAVLVSLPFAVILGTGILLESRAFVPWLQPQHASVSGNGLAVGFPEILEAVRSVPAAGMRSWSDVSSIVIRPGSGQIRVRAERGHWEVQIDGATGKVTGAGPRNATWITELHQGSLLGDFARYGVFTVSAVGVLYLLFSGLVLFALPYARRRRRKNPSPERIRYEAV